MVVIDLQGHIYVLNFYFVTFFLRLQLTFFFFFFEKEITVTLDMIMNDFILLNRPQYDKIRISNTYSSNQKIQTHPPFCMRLFANQKSEHPKYVYFRA